LVKALTLWVDPDGWLRVVIAKLATPRVPVPTVFSTALFPSKSAQIIGRAGLFAPKLTPLSMIFSPSDNVPDTSEIDGAHNAKDGIIQIIQKDSINNTNLFIFFLLDKSLKSGKLDANDSDYLLNFYANHISLPE
jgi:hypothetical protein